MYTSAAKAQAPKYPQPEEPKVWGPDLTVSTVAPRSNNFESSTKARWEKKKDRRGNDQRDRQGQEGSTPATRINAAELEEPN